MLGSDPELRIFAILCTSFRLWQRPFLLQIKQSFHILTRTLTATRVHNFHLITQYKSTIAPYLREPQQYGTWASLRTSKMLIFSLTPSYDTNNMQRAICNIVNIRKISANKPTICINYDDYLLPSMAHADSAHSSAPHRVSTCLHGNCGLFKLPIQVPTCAQRRWFDLIQHEPLSTKSLSIKK